jgi:hypothetical protein
MKKRWLVNLVLLLLVASLVAFLYLKPKAEIAEEPRYEISALKLSEFSGVRVDFPAKSQVAFDLVDGFWRMSAPNDVRADKASVLRIISIVAAKTKTKIVPAAPSGEFTADELAKFGVDNPSIKLNLVRPDASKETFLFGTYNPITEEQYVAHHNGVYLLPVAYSEAAATQVVELVDKAPLKPQEKVVGFDFSHLEQWADVRLRLNLKEGEWKVSAKEATPSQTELQEWVTYSWMQTAAESIELYKPDPRKSYPYLTIKMEDGSRVRFNKMQESPKLLIARPDEGIIYTYPSDEGFTMLNPPINKVEEDDES